MKDELISYPTAKLAKEIGFAEPCNYCYIGDGEKWPCAGYINDEDDSWSIPTQSLLARYLREKHGVHVDCKRVTFDDYSYDVEDWEDDIHSNIYGNGYKTYELAREEGLQQACEYLKTKLI